MGHQEPAARQRNARFRTRGVPHNPRLAAGLLCRRTPKPQPGPTNESGGHSVSARSMATRCRNSLRHDGQLRRDSRRAVRTPRWRAYGCASGWRRGQAQSNHHHRALPPRGRISRALAAMAAGSTSRPNCSSTRRGYNAIRSARYPAGINRHSTPTANDNRHSAQAPPDHPTISRVMPRNPYGIVHHQCAIGTHTIPTMESTWQQANCGRA